VKAINDHDLDEIINLTNELNSNFWRIPASWKAIVENNKIKHWQVFCDY
jgi:hypothetical protein